MTATEPPVLILGGTGEARELAAALVAEKIACVSSLAGRVSDPALPVGEVRIGGFGGADGLATWLTRHRCTTVVDATHPFAQQISRNAAEATTATSAQLISLRRPPWTPGPDDHWTVVADIGEAAAHVGTRVRRVFLTTGRQDVDEFAGIDDSWFLIRVVDPPTGPLPHRHRVLRSRGPYRLDDEREIMRTNQIDTLVTKNSGGALTSAKLRAAADLGVEVVMVQRPAPPDRGHAVTSVDDAVLAVRAAIAGQVSTRQSSP
ncbi:cobalt-precorrin-6A reductase [Williamsia sp. MIQD14]|uniref:cobalt-precorrin-6A reductase n=1 Tax=Williamsia sp. MIQD14 TaxID=3425703 RepID=UPI003DA11E58